MDKQVIPVKGQGLNTSFDPKSAPYGVFSLLENTQSQRTTEGGVEIEKRPGTPSISTSIDGGGSISAGAKLHALGSELLATDGNKLYAWSAAIGKWVLRGKVTDLAAGVTSLATVQQDNPATLSCDVAYANGYLCFTVFGGLSTDNLTNWYVQEVSSGAIVSSGHIGTAGSARKLRVLAVGNVFFLFYWDGTSTLSCRKIDTATPATISAASSVATNLNTGGTYDVMVDATNSRMVVAYRNTTPTLTLLIWTTGMSAGTTVAYATRDPDRGVGFLDHTFADGNGYVAIGTSATGVRVLTFGASSMTVGTDTLVDGATTSVGGLTGYFSTVRNVFYTNTATTNYPTILGWSNGTGFTVQRGVSLVSRAFAVGGKRYFMASYKGASTSLQQSLFLIETETDSVGTAGDAVVAGHLIQGNATERQAVGGLGAVAAVSSTLVVGAWSRIHAMQAPNLTLSIQHADVSRIDLDWSKTKLGAPVSFNGVLYFPGAAPKVYDGHDVQEVGFYTYPETLTLTPVTTGVTTAATYQYALVYSKIDRTGKVHRSAPSPIASVTVTSSQATVTMTIPTLKLTDTDPAHNLNALVPNSTIEVYRSEPNGSVLYLYRVLANDLTANTISLDDNGLTAGILGEPLYTGTGVADNLPPPAVLAFAEHRDRLFALTKDAIFPSKDVSSGDGVAFAVDTDGYFLEFDPTATGDLVGMVSDGTTLFATSRSRVYPIQGDGPDLSGNNGYAFPSPLPAPAGLRGPRGFVSTPDGIIVDTAKGKHLLDRAGGMLPIPGADAYDSLTVTGGVALDDRPMALLTTSDGRTLCWDWQLKVWHTWTGQAAVACCLWQNKFVWLESNGKVHVETPGAYSDDAGAYTWSVKPAWFNIRHCRIRKGLIYADILASTTVSYVASYDHDATTAEAAKTLAVTTATKLPLVLTGAKGRANALEYLITETSTTAGLRLSSLELEIMAKPGAAKFAAGSYLR